MIPTARPTAHLIHGFVGAGKTTFARQLARERAAVRFTHDAWMHRLYGPNPPVDKFPVLWDHVDSLIWQYAERLLSLGIDVVLDQGFWTRAGRDNARGRVAASGARAVLYHVTCSEETMRRRVLSRSQELPADALWINAEAFELFKERFEPLGDDEPHVLVASAELDEVVARVETLTIPETTMFPLFQKIDCICIPVPDLEEGLAYYRDRLGHELIWRTAAAAGLMMGEGPTEIVLYTEDRGFEVDIKVESVDRAAELIEATGGRVVHGPFDIRIGRCVIVADPWDNELVLLDTSKGLLVTDAEGNVIGNETPP